MATVIELERQGALFRVDPGLKQGEQEFRSLYVSPKLMKWIQEKLPGLGSTWNIELTPLEQMVSFIETYANGSTLVFGRSFKPISHVSGGVWELKTADIRVFGWFALKDVFLGHAADLTDKIKTHGLYHGYAGEVARFRDQLDLTEPKFVPGDDPNVVVSAFSYP